MYPYKTIFIAQDEILGKNIQYLRKQKRISRKLFAEMMGWQKLRLKVLEKGKSFEIPLQVLFRICDFFEIDHNTLLDVDLSVKNNQHS